MLKFGPTPNIKKLSSFLNFSKFFGSELTRICTTNRTSSEFTPKSQPRTGPGQSSSHNGYQETHQKILDKEAGFRSGSDVHRHRPRNLTAILKLGGSAFG